MKIELTDYAINLFRKKCSEGEVGTISVYYSGIVDEPYGLISLFDDVEKIKKKKVPIGD